MDAKTAPGLHGKVALVAFLASEEALYVTGAAIAVDGGFLGGV